MDWEAAGAVGEIVGAIAVVASLAYLAVQIRTQNREARAASVHEVLQHYSNAVSRLHEPEMADIWVAAMESFDGLTPSQRLRFVIYLTVAVRSFEDAYYQWRQDRLEDDVWRALLTSLTDVKSTDGFARFWQLRRHHFRPEFADYIDSLEAGEYSF